MPLLPPFSALQSEEVILRHLRIRVGDTKGPGGDLQRTLGEQTHALDLNAMNIIVDHCDIAFDFQNNIIYNLEGAGYGSENDYLRLNYVGNTLIKGPDSKLTSLYAFSEKTRYAQWYGEGNRLPEDFNGIFDGAKEVIIDHPHSMVPYADLMKHRGSIRNTAEVINGSRLPSDILQLKRLSKSYIKSILPITSNGIIKAKIYIFLFINLKTQTQAQI